MSKQPFMPLWVSDFLGSTMLWPGEARALYLLLLAIQWASGPLPSDLRQLAKVVQYSYRTFTKLWTFVGTKFVLVEGHLCNTRLQEHRQRAQEISARNSESGRKGAMKTWAGKHGDGHGENDGAAMAPAIDSPSNSDGIHSNPFHSQSERDRKPSRSRARRLSLPTDFPLTEARRAIAANAGKDPEGTFKKFCAYFTRGKGIGHVSDDWHGEWEMWVLNERQPGANGAATPEESRASAEADSMRKLMDRRPMVAGLQGFRDPKPGETSDQYRVAQDVAWNEHQAKSRPPVPVVNGAGSHRKAGMPS